MSEVFPCESCGNQEADDLNLLCTRCSRYTCDECGGTVKETGEWVCCECALKHDIQIELRV